MGRNEIIMFTILNFLSSTIATGSVYRSSEYARKKKLFDFRGEFFCIWNVSNHQNICEEFVCGTQKSSGLRAFCLCCRCRYSKERNNHIGSSLFPTSLRNNQPKCLQKYIISECSDGTKLSECDERTIAGNENENVKRCETFAKTQNSCEREDVQSKFQSRNEIAVFYWWKIENHRYILK